MTMRSEDEMAEAFGDNEGAYARSSEDDLFLLNMMSGGKPHLQSTTEPRKYHSSTGFSGRVSLFAQNCFPAEMMACWDAEVGRPIPAMASLSYKTAYADRQMQIALEGKKH
jgi:hypothetical protein